MSTDPRETLQKYVDETPPEQIKADLAKLPGAEPEQRPHHDYSPSTLQSLEVCPNYQSKQSDTPHPRTVIGTIAHGATETGEDDARLSDDDTEHVAACIDFYERRKTLMHEARAREVQQRAVGHWGAKVEIGEEANAELRAEGEVPPVKELKETYLPVDDAVFVDEVKPPYGNEKRTVLGTTAGYIDSALINHDRTYAEIFDWKFGRWPVEEAVNNLQGIAYALGMFRGIATLKKVRYFFKQPLIDYITDAEIAREDIPEHYLRIQVIVARARIARTRGDWSMARAMAPACNFCAHIGECPVVTEFALSVGKKFSPLEIPPDITPTMVHNEHDTRIGLTLSEVMAVWAKAFKGVITNRVLGRLAEPPDGYTIASRTPREIADEKKYREVALRYLTEEEYAATLKASFGSVEQLISDKAPRGQKKAEVEKFGREIEECGAVVKGNGYSFLQAVPKKAKT